MTVQPSSSTDIPPVECPVGTPLAEAPPTAGVSPLLPRGRFVSSRFSAIPQWGQYLDERTWSAFLNSCSALEGQTQWQEICHAATALGLAPTPTQQKQFFEQHFSPWMVVNNRGANVGLVTGYYEPLLHGSLARTPRYQFPLYAPPSDLLTVDLGDVVPELKGRRIRGRLQGNRVVPYLTRAEIDSEDPPLTGLELAWVDNPVDLFFLQIQGSGRLLLPDGQIMHVGYADQNGQPFRSIAKELDRRGELPLARASLENIRNWARTHPEDVGEILDANPSYVFFRKMPDNLSGPIGTLGVPLTGQASIAVDAHVIPLGVPVFLDTTRPNSQTPLRRLVMAQDTGGAIYGAIRADFFWGFGADAEKNAGSMKQAGRMWILYPQGFTPPDPH